MKFKIVITLITLCLLSCKTYYFSPYIKGEIKSSNKALDNVEIHFLNENTIYYSNDEGIFEIPPIKKNKMFGTPNMREARAFNSSLLLFQKQGFLNDTIDIREYEFDKSIFSCDTIILKTINLKKIINKHFVIE